MANGVLLTGDPQPSAVLVRDHPIYYFEDGSLILDVEFQRFKLHRTFLSRHSRFFSSQMRTPVKSHGVPSDETHIVLEPKWQVKVEDVEALLQHLYHDVSLRKDSPFAHIVSLLRVSSPQQLDFPNIHATAREILEGMFPDDPAAFAHNHPLHDALAIATNFNLTSVCGSEFVQGASSYISNSASSAQVRKAILYSLVTTTDFNVSETGESTVDPQKSLSNLAPSKTEGHLERGENASSESRNDGITSSAVGDVPASTTARASTTKATGANGSSTDSARELSPEDARVCLSLMTRIIEHFTPILFTPPATSHMECTDVFAETWMPLVIQPALDDDGVYKPLETLERIKRIEWATHGLCESCVEEKKEEWTEEQRTVWRLMDGWLNVGTSDNSGE